MDEVYKQLATIIPILLLAITLQSSLARGVSAPPELRHGRTFLITTYLVAVALLIIAEALLLWGVGMDNYNSALTSMAITSIVMALILMVLDFIYSAVGASVQRRAVGAFMVVLWTVMVLEAIILIFVGFNFR